MDTNIRAGGSGQSCQLRRHHATHCAHLKLWGGSNGHAGRYRVTGVGSSPLKLTGFLGRLPVRGQLKLKVSFGNRLADGSLTDLGCFEPNLCGRDFIQAFRMLKAPVMNGSATGERLPFVGTDVNVERLVTEFADVFARGLGLIKGPPVHFEKRDNVVPKFWKAREVPYAFRPRADAELDRLLAAGIIVPVPHYK